MQLFVYNLYIFNMVTSLYCQLAWRLKTIEQDGLMVWKYCLVFHVLPTQCIYVFGMDLRTNGDYFPTQH